MSAVVSPPLNREQLSAVNEACMAWRETPFHHQARVKGAGVDCANLLIGVYSDAGIIEPFDLPDYPEDWMMHRDAERFLETIRQYADEVDEPAPGDTIVMRFGRCFSHGAIYIGNRVICHSYVKRPVSLDNLDAYMPRAMRYFRVRT